MIIISCQEYYHSHLNYKKDELYCMKYPDNYKEYYKGNLLHREDGPAIERITGDKEWWIDGKKIKVNSQKEFEQYLNTIAFR